MPHRLSYIEALILEGESLTLDFKYNISDSRKLARSMVAFANTKGGRLLIGVRDNGSIAGIRSDEELFMLEAAANMYSKPEIVFEAHEWTIDQKQILEVVIGESEQKPHYAMDEHKEWKAWLRHHDQNMLANAVMIKVWKRQHQKKGSMFRYTRKEKILLDHLKTHDEVRLKDIQSLLKLPKYLTENILVTLIVLDIVDIVIKENDFTYSIK